MKQVITATASLVLILFTFTNIFVIQVDTAKISESKVRSIRFIEKIKSDKCISDEVKSEWKTEIGKVYKCNPAYIEIMDITEVYEDKKVIEIDLSIKDDNLKEPFLGVKRLDRLIHFTIRI